VLPSILGILSAGNWKILNVLSACEKELSENIISPEMIKRVRNGLMIYNSM
jgi:hypothetical protein